MSPVVLVYDISESADNFHVSLSDVVLRFQRVLDDSMGDIGQCHHQKSFDQRYPFVRRSRLGRMVRLWDISPVFGSNFHHHSWCTVSPRVGTNTFSCCTWTVRCNCRTVHRKLLLMRGMVYGAMEEEALPLMDSSFGGKCDRHIEMIMVTSSIKNLNW